MVLPPLDEPAARLIAEAQDHIARGADDAALAALHRVAEAKPSGQAWEAALRCAGRTGRAAEIERLADGWFRAQPHQRVAVGTALFDLGSELRKAGRLGAAVSCLKQSRRLAPELATSQVPMWAHLTALAPEMATDSTVAACLQMINLPDQQSFRMPAINMILQRHAEAVARIGSRPDGSCVYYPLYGQIELTAYCQLKCPFCRTGGALRHDYPEVTRGLMSRETFMRIMDEVPSLFHILFYNWGEPLLHKDLPWFLSAAKELGKVCEISSNMQYLPDAMAEGIVRSQLDYIRVSCDGMTQETYEHYRKGGSLEKLLENTRRLIAWKRKLDSQYPKIIFQMVVNRTNEHEADAYAQFAAAHGADLVHLMGTSPVTPEGYRQMNAFEANDPRFKRFGYGEPLQSCAKPWSEISVDWNGDIHLCCNPSGIQEYRLGNLNEQAFEEIWNGNWYRYARRLCTTQQPEDIGFNAPCHTCFRKFPTREMAENDRWGRVVGPLEIGVGRSPATA
jgi:radical SAM protein with 4Fe4S-binding SPASM domain